MIPHFLKPVHWLKYTSNKFVDPDDPFWTVGDMRSLRWQLWWSRYLPYRLYPAIPFTKQVHWHWRSKTLTLPLPWAKDMFADVREDKS